MCAKNAAHLYGLLFPLLGVSSTVHQTTDESSGIMAVLVLSAVHNLAQIEIEAGEFYAEQVRSEGSLVQLFESVMSGVSQAWVSKQQPHVQHLVLKLGLLLTFTSICASAA